MNQTDIHQPHAMPVKPDDGESLRTLLRLRLSLAIKKAIEQRDLTHATAALIARTPRTSITAIANGNLDEVSLDRLVMIAHRLGDWRRHPPHLTASKPRHF